jgi:hypothetical protein
MPRSEVQLHVLWGSIATPSVRSTSIAVSVTAGPGLSTTGSFGAGALGFFGALLNAALTLTSEQSWLVLLGCSSTV